MGCGYASPDKKIKRNGLGAFTGLLMGILWVHVLTPFWHQGKPTDIYALILYAIVCGTLGASYGSEQKTKTVIFSGLAGTAILAIIGIAGFGLDAFIAAFSY